MTYTLGPRYKISNAALQGTFFLAPGIGNIIGARIAGRLADSTVAKWLEKRNAWVPEDRLRSTLWGAGIVLPLGVLGSGFTMQFFLGYGGLALSLIFLVVCGIGLMMVLTATNTYCVDVMQSRSAEVIAVNK